VTKIFRQGLLDKTSRDHDKHRRYFKQTLPWYFRDQVTQTFSRDEKNQEQAWTVTTSFPRTFSKSLGTRLALMQIVLVPSSPPPSRNSRLGEFPEFQNFQKKRQPRAGWPKFYFMVIQTKTSIFNIAQIYLRHNNGKKVLISLQNPFSFGTSKQLYAIHFYLETCNVCSLAIPEFFAYNMCTQLLTTDSLFDVEKPKVRFSIFIDFYWFSMIYWFLLKSSCSCF